MLETRQLDAATDKASLDVTLTSVTEKLKQVAVTINDIPNAILESVDAPARLPQFRGFFPGAEGARRPRHGPDRRRGSTLRHQRHRTHRAPSQRCCDMRATGANPTIAVLNPTDSASLDLEADAGGFVFPTRDTGSSSPLWGLRVIERIGAGTEAPYLIDPQMLGQLYLGNIRFEADPFSAFRRT
jgi:hypothetical protein